MPANNRWPEAYGFSIYGHGPCYVTFVERGGVAHHAGLMPGDQILQLDGHDASNMSSEYVKKLAKHSRTVPPSVGVTSRVQYVELIPSRRNGFGLTLRGSNSKAVLVESVDLGSPAFKAGLRRGDIVLEANGRRIRSPEVVQPLLDLRQGKLTLAIVAFDKSNVSMEDKYQSSGSRVRKARELFSKMNVILGSDYEKKMAVVGVLKQYAEDRQVEKFSRALSILLPSRNHRRLVPEIRPFVPVRHRPKFDAVLEHNPVEPEYIPSGGSDLSTMPPSTSTAETSSVPKDIRRTLTIKRDVEGGFGFILRGHNPVYVESTDPGGPADAAGLIPGDAILRLNGLDVKRCSHGHLVKLLQGSGLSPTMEVIHSVDENGVPLRQEFSFGSSSSQSSHASSSWLSEHSIRDQEGKSFREKVDYLFTSKEKSSLRKALTRYNTNKNIDRLVGELSVLLDTPSKQTLWVFVLPLLPMEHQEMCLEHINLPHHVIEDVIPAELRQNLVSTKSRPGPSSNDVTSGDETETSDLRFSFYESSPSASDGLGSPKNHSMNHKNNMASFKHQLEFLLTSRERSQLKKALQIYAEKRNIHYLVEDVMVILDTPSKRSLWQYILPLLSNKHQEYCRKKFGIGKTDIDGSRGSSVITNGLASPVDSTNSENGILSASPRRGDVSYHEEFDYSQHMEANGFSLRPGSGYSENTDKYTQSSDTEVDSEPVWNSNYGKHSPTRASYVVSKPVYSSGKGGPIKRSKQYSDSEVSNDTEVQSDVSHNPIYESHLVEKESKPTIIVRVVKETSVQTSPVHQARPVMGVRVLPTNNSSTVNPYETVEFHSQNGHSSSQDSHHHHNNGGFQSDHSENSVSANYTSKQGKNHGDSHNYVHYNGQHAHLDPHVEKLVSGYERIKLDSESESSVQSSPSLQTTRTLRSSESFNTKARNAIRALDDVVANEITDVDSVVVKSSHRVAKPHSKSPAPNIPPPPAPPPPPPVPPPPPPVGKSIDITDSTLMQVKRINWEKLDVNKESLKNTVWAQCADSHDYLNDVVKYLELEQQFSLKKKSTEVPSLKEKRKEISILSPKKAYNISILLAHLKMSIPEIKDALFSIDEDFLSPQLLSQMIAYAPDTQEMEKYDAYDGKLEELSKADQFAYQLSRVPGYEQRLKALLFKANFAEKVEEVKENLKCLRKASQEIKHSKKLARVLELVLAMGNYLNKGHTRIGQAAAFKISFLSHLHTTKTSDNKSTFLHVLAWAVYTKMPDVLTIRDELSTVPEAAKLTNEDITRELNDLRKVLQDISATIGKISGHQVNGGNDRFQDVMGHFISTASDELQNLFSLQTATIDEFKSMVQYFGEDPKSATTNDIFGIFADFLTRFEQAHHQNIIQRRT